MARRFRFKLEVVERLRRQRVDAQRRMVATKLRALARMEDRMAQLNQQLRETVEQTRWAQQRPSLDLVSLRGQQYFKARLHREIMQADLERVDVLAELQQERTRLSDASKQLKVIEKLRERQWRRHKEAVRRENQAESDEAATQMFLRRQRTDFAAVGAAGRRFAWTGERGSTGRG